MTRANKRSSLKEDESALLVYLYTYYSLYLGDTAEPVHHTEHLNHIQDRLKNVPTFFRKKREKRLRFGRKFTLRFGNKNPHLFLISVAVLLGSG